MSWQILRFSLTLAVVSRALITPAAASNWTDFTDCLSHLSTPYTNNQWNGTTGTCTLPPGTYTTTSTVTVSSPYVRYVATGSGGTVSTSPVAIIQRDVTGASLNSPFAILRATSATHDLVFEYLKIDGNRAAGSGQPLMCGDVNWIDVDLTSAGSTGSTSYPGASVQYMTFVNAPGYAMTMGNWGYVYSSTFQYARLGDIYEYGHNLVTTNTFEYSGNNAVVVTESDVRLQYNTFTQNHDEWPDTLPGGQLFIPQEGTATNFTILGNVFDGGSAMCSGSGCFGPYLDSPTNSLHCPITYASNEVTDGIESYRPGGTYNDNYIYAHKGDGLFAANIDGSGISAVSGAFSSTTASQAMLVENDTTGPSIYSNTLEGVHLYYNSNLSGNFNGSFVFSDVRSENNLDYGFQWNTGGHALGGSTSLSWGTGNAACLTGNSTGPISSLPSPLTGPSSTSTCP